jgi:hypothetical protein
MVEEFKGVLVRKLNHRVFKRTNLFEHLVSDLRIQAHSTVFKLVEGGVEGFVNV